VDVTLFGSLRLHRQHVAEVAGERHSRLQQQHITSPPQIIHNNLGALCHRLPIPYRLTAMHLKPVRQGDRLDL
jgi:hypothetical protein